MEDPKIEFFNEKQIEKSVDEYNAVCLNAEKKNNSWKKWIIIGGTVFLTVIVVIFLIFFKNNNKNKSNIQESQAKSVEANVTVDFSSSESTILTLEKKLINENNIKLYTDRTYISNSLAESLQRDLYLTVDEFNKRWQEELPSILKIKMNDDNIDGLKVESVDFIDRTNTDVTHVYLSYKITYTNKKVDYDSSYLIKLDDGWYINFEPEYEDMKTQDGGLGGWSDPNSSWGIFKRLFSNVTAQKKFREESNFSELNKKLHGEWMIDIIRRHESEVADIMQNKENNNAISMQDRFISLCTEKGKNILKTNKDLFTMFAYSDIEYIKNELYTNNIISKVNGEPDDIVNLFNGFYFGAIGDDRIRFYMDNSFVPYDLVFEDGKWKIDLDVSLQYMDDAKIRRKLGGISKDLDSETYSESLLFRLVDALESYKNKFGYFPKKMKELFPDFLPYPIMALKDEYNAPYAYSPSDNPQKVHIAVYARNEQPIKFKSNSNSIGKYVDGFDGRTSFSKKVGDIDFDQTPDKQLGSGKTLKKNEGVLIDLISDDFGKFKIYFNNLLSKSTIKE